MKKSGKSHYRLQVFEDGYACTNNEVILELSKEGYIDPYECSLAFLIGHMAVYKPMSADSRTGTVELKTHQVITSINDICTRTGWGRKKVQDTLKSLEKKGIIKFISKGQGGTVLEFMQSRRRKMSLEKAVSNEEVGGLQESPPPDNQVSNGALIPSNQVSNGALIPSPLYLKNYQEKNTIYKSTGSVSFLSHWGGKHELLNWLVDQWNARPKLVARQKAVRPVGNELRKALEVLEERPDQEYWTKVLDAFEGSSWLLKNTKKPLGWLITSGKADEILAGGYGFAAKKKQIFIDED